MIHVIDDYVIDSDGTQYMMGKLGESISKKDGTKCVYIKNPSYYGTISSALLAISRRLRADAVKDTTGTLNDAYEAIRRADERLIKAVEKFGDIKIVKLDSEKE